MGDHAVADPAEIVLDQLARASLAYRLPGDPPTVDGTAVERLIASRDAAGLAALVAAGDVVARLSAGRLIGVAVDARHAGLLAALRGMPAAAGERVDASLAVLLVVAVGRSSDAARARIVLAAGFPPDGAGALHRAGTAGAVHVLLDAGADPDLVDERGWLPAASMLRLGSLDALEALLDGGADIGLFIRSIRAIPLWSEAEQTLAPWLAGLPVKPWFEPLVTADPTAPWAMTLLARMAQAEAESDVGDQSTGAVT